MRFFCFLGQVSYINVLHSNAMQWCNFYWACKKQEMKPTLSLWDEEPVQKLNESESGLFKYHPRWQHVQKCETYVGGYEFTNRYKPPGINFNKIFIVWVQKTNRKQRLKLFLGPKTNITCGKEGCLQLIFKFLLKGNMFFTPPLMLTLQVIMILS